MVIHHLIHRLLHHQFRVVQYLEVSLLGVQEVKAVERVGIQEEIDLGSQNIAEIHHEKIVIRYDVMIVDVTIENEIIEIVDRK